jgi:iron complex transport system substrate-binding protein
MGRRGALLVAVLALAGCRFGNQETGEHSQRLVSLTKQYSEIIYALGAQKDLVAVDLSSTYPPEIKSLPTVGYHRALSVEGILAVKPTLILHNNDIGPEHVAAQLQSLKIPMKVFEAKGVDVPSTEALITEMGAFFHREARAKELNAKLEADLQQARSLLPAAKRPRVMVIHFGRAMNVYLTMTKASTAARLVEWASGEMAVEGERGMVQLSPEVVARANPEVLLLTDFGYDRLGTRQEIASTLPGIGTTAAARTGRIYRIEEHDLVYIGPRTGENVLKLHDLLTTSGVAAH